MQIELSTTAVAELEDIAKRCLGIDVLAERKSDRLDFHELSVVSILKALEAAYLAGMVDRLK